MKNFMEVIINQTDNTYTTLIIKPSDILLPDEIDTLFKSSLFFGIWDEGNIETKCKRTLGLFDKDEMYVITNNTVKMEDKDYHCINNVNKNEDILTKYWMVEKDLLQHLFYSKNELRKEKITKLLNGNN